MSNNNESNRHAKPDTTVVGDEITQEKPFIYYN
jgi:hypothetical protein